MYFKSWDSNVEAKQKSGSPKGVYPSVQNCIFEIDSAMLAIYRSACQLLSWRRRERPVDIRAQGGKECPDTEEVRFRQC